MHADASEYWEVHGDERLVGAAFLSTLGAPACFSFAPAEGAERFIEGHAHCDGTLAGPVSGQHLHFCQASPQARGCCMINCVASCQASLSQSTWILSNQICQHSFHVTCPRMSFPRRISLLSQLLVASLATTTQCVGCMALLSPASQGARKGSQASRHSSSQACRPPMHKACRSRMAKCRAIQECPPRACLDSLGPSSRASVGTHRSSRVGTPRSSRVGTHCSSRAAMHCSKACLVYPMAAFHMACIQEWGALQACSPPRMGTLNREVFCSSLAGSQVKVGSQASSSFLATQAP